MAQHKIAVIAGDGIGPEVITEGVKVLKHIAKKDENIPGRFKEKSSKNPPTPRLSAQLWQKWFSVASPLITCLMWVVASFFLQF